MLLGVLQAKGNFEEAIKMLEEAVRINPQDAEVHYRLGQLLYTHTKRLDEAVAHIKEAAKLDPTLSDPVPQNEQQQENI